MKYLIIVLFLFPLVCRAEVFVIYDKNTKEIYTLSEKDDTVVPEGKEKISLKGDMQSLGLDNNPVYYKYLNGKFIVNNQKINEDYQKDLEYEEKEAQEKLIQNKIRKMAIKELKAEGVEIKED